MTIIPTRLVRCRPLSTWILVDTCFEQQSCHVSLLQGYVDRKVAAAQEMIKKMYLPHLEAADINFSVNVHVVEGQRSAAGIAEQVVQAASAANSDLLAVTSHGGCLSSISYMKS
jgi:hypothetical protein